MQIKTLGRCEGFLTGAKILGNWPESHTLLGGMGLAARHQRRANNSVWLRDAMLVWWCYRLIWNWNATSLWCDEDPRAKGPTTGAM